MGRLNILNGDEEEKYFWPSSSGTEADAAREKFNQFIRKGFLACKIIDHGKTGVQISEFDPEAEEIFMLGLSEGG